MVIASQIQDKISNILERSDLTTDITLVTITVTENDWGLDDYIQNTTSTIKGIVLNYESAKKRYDETGLYNNSSFILLLPADTVLTTGDLVDFKSKRYMVDGITEPVLNNLTMLKRVFVSEIKLTS